MKLDLIGRRRPLTLSALLCILFVSAPSSPAQADFRVSSGSFEGNGSSSRAITGVGFQPDFVLIKTEESKTSVVKTATMPGNLSKPVGDADDMITDGILSLDPDGFTVGDEDRVNKSNRTLYWTAFQADPGVLSLGTYVGNKVDGRVISGAGFQPEYVLVMGDNNRTAFMRYADQPFDDAFSSSNKSASTNRIQDFAPDGFELGNNDDTNKNGDTYHWIAFNATPNAVTVGSYVGNGSDNRNITGVGIDPEFVLLKIDDSKHAIHRNITLSGDLSLALGKQTTSTNRIQSLGIDSFQVGNNDDVNKDNKDVFWLAVREISGADMSITKSVDDTNPQPGESITYALSLSNAGPVDATGVQVTDLLPAGLTFQSASASQGSYNSGSGIWTVGGVLNGAGATLNITATVDAGTAGDVINNTASVTAVDQPDPNVGNESDSAALTVQSADLGITKSVDDPAPNEGQSVQFTVTVTNNGPNTASNIIVDDLLPAGFSAPGVGISQGSYDSGTGIWTVGSLANGASATLTLTPTIAAGTGGSTLTNTATITASTPGDPNSANDSAAAAVDVQGADLAITKTVSSPAPLEGSTITYMVTVSNLGPDAATSVQVTDLLPTGVSYQFDLPSQGSYASGTGVWTVGSLANGASATLDITASVNLGTEGMTIDNTATVTAADQADGNAGNDSDTATIVPVVPESATINAVQSGTTTSGGNGTVTVPITAVDPSRSFLIFNTSHNSNRSPGSLIRGRIASSTSLEFARVTNETSPIDIQWYVVEYAQGVRVQRGETTQSATTIDIPLAIPVASLNQAFATWSKTPGELDGVWSDDDILAGELTSTSNLQLRVDRANTGHIIWWEVVEYMSPSDINVQKGSLTSMTATTTSVTATLPTPVDPAKTFVLIGYRTGGSGADIGTRMLRAQLTNSTTITIDRALTNGTDAIDEIVWQAVELNDGSSVQHASQNFPVGVAQQNIGITPVDLSRAAAFASGSPSGGQSTGRSTQVADDILGVGSVTAALGSPSQLTLERGSTAETADIGWFVVEFGASLEADLAVTKVVDDGIPNEGGTVVYTITAANNGPGDATGVVLTDALPVGLTYVSSNASQGAYDDGSGAWTVGAVANGSNATLTLTATVDPGTGGSTISNTASVTALDQIDANPVNNTASADIVVQSSDLGVSKVADDGTPDENDTVVYTVTLSNGGPNDATNVAVTDQLPAGVTFVSAAPSQGSYDDGTGIWTVGTVTDGGNATLAITTTVDAGTANSTITNTASISAADQADGNAANDIASADIVVADNRVDIEVVKTVIGNDRPSEGENVVYRINITNNGPATATSVAIADTLPAQMSFVSASASPGTYNPATGIWTVGNLAPSATAFLQITTTPDPGTAGTTITNTGQLASVDQVDTNAANDVSSADITVPGVDLSVTKTVDDPTPLEGETITYTITLANAGPDSATSVVLEDVLPTGVTFQSFIASQGGFVPPLGEWIVGTILSGENAVLSLTATVDGGTGGSTITNTASVLSVTETDTNAANDSDSVDIDVGVFDGDLEIAKVVDNATPGENATVTYTVTLTNNGPADVTGIEVTDQLPAGVTFVSATPSQGSYDDGTGVWTVGNLNNGGVLTLAITATVDGGTAGTTISNTATITAADQSDSNAGNNASTAEIDVPAVDISVAKGVDDTTPLEGASIVYTIGLANAGPDGATGVQVTDLLPAGVTFVSAAPSQGTYDDLTGLWDVGSVGPSVGATLMITATVDPGTANTTITNTATVTAVDQDDTDTGNDVSSADINVGTFDTDLVMAKSVDDTSPAVGDTINYTLTVTNAGPQDANDIEVDDLLSAGLTFLSATPSQGTYDDGTGLWTVGSVLNGGNATLTVTASVNDESAGDTITNTATISPDGRSDPLPGNDSATVDVFVFEFIDVAVGDAADPAESNSTGAAWIDYDNDGDLDMYNGGFLDANQLLRNDGNEIFVNVASGPEANSEETAAISWADYDNDGDLDLFNAQVNAGASVPRLIRNDGGTFADVTSPDMQASSAAVGASWADYDGDGDVDLYVAALGQPNQLYRNDGGDNFVNATPAVLANTGNGTAVAWGDYDGDGDQDIYLGKGGSNILYNNLGNGAFSNVTNGPLGNTDSTFGVVWGDYDNDEDLDLAFVNAGAPDKLLRNDGGNNFVDVTPAVMTNSVTVGQSLAMADYDNDGDLDIVIGNATPSIKRAVDPPLTADRLFRNDGNENWADVSDGAFIVDEETQGISWGDFDADGDLDVYLATSKGPNRLMRNDQSNGNGWLQVELMGTMSNRSAIGARVRIEAGGVTQIREVSGGSGYLSQDSLPLEFGLGQAAAVDNLTVFWPSGLTSSLVGVAANQVLTIIETDVTDLALTKTVDNPTPAVGDVVTFTLTLTNDGPTDATGLEVTDLLPAAFSIDSFVISQGTFTPGPNLWVVGALTNGSSATLDLTTSVIGGAGTTVTNTALITARDQADPNTLNDAVSADLEIFFFVDATTTPLDDTGPNTGVAWGDYDGDGDLDLYNGAFVGPNRLFQNEGNGTFVDVATGVGANPGKTNGATWADYDNDGDLDLYYSNRGSNTNRLLRNDGSPDLLDVTPAVMASTLNGQGIAWVDYDLDGDVDMYLANLNGANQLFRNDGGDVFVDASFAPINDAGSTTSVAWGDYDSDGDSDLYIANGGPNRLFRNDGPTSFVDVTSGSLGDANSSFGADWGDYDNDGDLDLFFVNVGQPNRLMRNDGNDSFVDVTTAPLDDALGQGQSTAWADIDNDGDLDLFISNLSGTDSRLVRNDGNGAFADITHPLMTDGSGDAQGMAWGDYDADGDMDLYVANAGQSNRLYRNESNIGNRWIHVNLTGVTSNASGIGARVEVEAGGVTQIREVSGGSGYLSQNSLTAEFGLGTTSTIDNVIVRWPSGIVDVIPSPAVDQLITVVESPPGNQPPTLTIPADQQNNDGEVIAGVSASATDPDVGDNLVFSATGLPPSLSINPSTGEITGTIDCGADAGSPYTVTVEVDDGNGHMVTDQFTWTVTANAPVAIADLSAVQPKTLNAGAPTGTTRITVSWTGVDPGASVEVYRKGYGNYPEYDDTGGSVPTAPATPGDALLEGWTLTSVTASGNDDTSATRDLWYYVAFITDACGRVSTVSNLTGGTLNYHLGDVSDGFTVGTGDRLVNAIDLSFLSALYGSVSTDVDFDPILDVGPTQGGTVDGRPQTDNVIDFEDLIIQSLNFNMVSKERVLAELSIAPQALLTARVPYADEKGSLIDVRLDMQGDDRVRGLSVQLSWNPAIVEPAGFAPGDLLHRHGVPSAVLSPRPGTVDAAIFASSEVGIRGQGHLASLQFRVLRPGEPGISIERVDARGLSNEPVSVETQLEQSAPGLPKRSALTNNYPNPFNPRTTISYGVAVPGRVAVKIYSVDGRLVRTVIDDELVAGSYEAVWNGVDDAGRGVSSGVYIVHLQASDQTDTRRITLIK